MPRVEAVGVAGARLPAFVDAVGTLTVADLSIECWAGADDGWHVPRDDATTRHRRLGVAPSYETRVRVAGGDVVQRVYAVSGPSGGPAVVLEVENDSPAPCSLAFVLRLPRGRAPVALDGATVTFDAQPLVHFSNRPRLWADGTPDAVRAAVCSGGARDDSPPVWQGPRDVALLVPAAHRTVVRLAIAPGPVDVRALPDVESVERGWLQLLDRGMRVELPAPWQEIADAARADTLLPYGSARELTALEDWGFDAEAAAIWARLGFGGRRAARRRRAEAEPWRALRAADTDAADVLCALRAVLLHERRGEVDLLPGFAPEWLGQDLAVLDAPLREGKLSFAVRWHGARPALLWDAPEGVTLRAPVLDPGWSSDRPVGETLLAEPPPALLPMGSRDQSGAPVDPPDSFS